MVVSSVSSLGSNLANWLALLPAVGELAEASRLAHPKRAPPQPPGLQRAIAATRPRTLQPPSGAKRHLARSLTRRCSGCRLRCSARSSGTRFCGRICGEGRVATTPRPMVTTAAAATAATRAALPPPLLRTAAAARVGSAAASILSLVAAPPPAAPGRALEYPALRGKGPACERRRTCESS